MRNWQELSALTMAGKHIRLQNITQSELELFCLKHSEDKNLSSCSIAGNVRGYKITDFSYLSQLPALKELYVEDAISQSGFEQVCKLVELTELHVQHAGKISSLESVAQLTQLLGLTISTPPGWDPKRLHLPSAAPIGELRNLKQLNLAGIAFDTGRIGSFSNLHQLQELIVISTYWEDAIALKESCPYIDTEHFISLIQRFKKK